MHRVLQYLLFSLALYAGSSIAVGTGLPSVDNDIDPAKSFWKDHVHYPFPVRYAKATDARNITWEVAYMDEYTGPQQHKTKAKTLILIHGRGTNAGTWGDIMQAALKNGLRVIALDIPHYGKSIPGNIDNPLTRSLEDVREIFHRIIVDQLKVEKATYLGHSLGGQIVFGYALRYPQNVERLIAMAPGGLEEFTPSMRFSPTLERDFAKWDEVWQKTGQLSREFARAPYTIEPDYYFRGDGRSFGYFYKDGTYPRFITDIRIKMISANEREYRNYINTYVHESYTVGIEVQKDNPLNLNRRLVELKMPVLLIMGEADPLYPVKSITGNSDIRLDMIKPFADRLRAAGNPPQIKVYAGAGHFPYTDNPEQFSKDVLAFVAGQNPTGLEDVAYYPSSWTRRIGLHRTYNNLMQKLIWDCFSKN